jgi:hypothetical protein
MTLVAGSKSEDLRALVADAKQRGLMVPEAEVRRWLHSATSTASQ